MKSTFSRRKFISYSTMATVTAVVVRNGAAADNETVKVRGKAFVDPRAQARIGAILESIASVEKVPNAMALKAEKEPPFPDPVIEKWISQRDPKNRRATNGKVARDMLKMRVVLGDKREEPQLRAWEAAVSLRRPERGI
jgi:hypothetical protein